MEVEMFFYLPPFSYDSLMYYQLYESSYIEYQPVIVKYDNWHDLLP